MTIERRVISVTAPIQRADERRRIVGHASVFNVVADVGWFREKVAPGAFADVLGNDVRALIDHQPTLILGRTRAGTLALAEDERGLKVEIDLPDTQVARDLAVSMERGDINQMSIGFRVAISEWDDTQEPPLRTIKKLAELLDVSVVTFPAFEQTDAQLRSVRAVFDARPVKFRALNTRRRLASELALRGELTR